MLGRLKYMKETHLYLSLVLWECYFKVKGYKSPGTDKISAESIQ
jgi:hypothetical protein